MDTPDSASNDALRLKRLLKGAGLRSYRLDPRRRIVNFIGRTREWALVVALNPSWVNISTLVCELPKEPGVRVRLMEWAMQANCKNSLLKYSITETTLLLELDYRAEHVDETVLGNLVGFLQSSAEEQYPRVFRIVNGDDVLESLGRTLEASPAS
jgi:hypothetical protein